MLVCYILYYILINVHMCVYMYNICIYMFCFDGVSQGDLVAMRYDIMTNMHYSL